MKDEGSRMIISMPSKHWSLVQVEDHNYIELVSGNAASLRLAPAQKAASK